MVKSALIKFGIKRENKHTHAITKRRLTEHTRDAVKYPEMMVPVFAHTVKKIVRCSINMKTMQSAQVPVTLPRRPGHVLHYYISEIMPIHQHFNRFKILRYA